MYVSELSLFQKIAYFTFLTVLSVGINYVLLRNWLKSPLINKVATVVINLFLAAVLVASISQAAKGDLTLNIGAGKGITGDPGTPFERVVALGYEHRFPIGLFVRPEAGYFLDVSGQGKSSLWVAPIVGVRARSQVGPELHLAAGPGFLQHPDHILGGYFQFSLEGGIGLSDENLFVGLVWKHLSSGGLQMPNHGRDFICAQVRIFAL